jgi:hypothetical protein
VTADLREALAALLPEGCDLVEQHGLDGQSAGVRRWRAKAGKHHQLIVEHWSRRHLPEQRWYVRVQGVGMLLELAEGVTVEKAVDACVLAGVLPVEAGSQYRVGALTTAGAVASAYRQVDSDDQAAMAAASACYMAALSVADPTAESNEVDR